MMNGRIQLAQRILEGQGYLVIGFRPGPKPPHKIGDVIRGSISGVPGPFVVIGHATREDRMKQAETYEPFWVDEVVALNVDAICFFKVTAE